MGKVNFTNIPGEIIERKIYLVRGHKVMLDSDIAYLYGVENKRLLEAVKRNSERFPEDFMFQLSMAEYRLLKSRFSKDVHANLEQDQGVTNLRSQVATSSSQRADNTNNFEDPGYGGRRSLPFCFTEQGIAMLSAVLRSPRAIAVSIEVVRTFVKLREMLASNQDLARQLAALEERYDSQFKIVFDAIRELRALISQSACYSRYSSPCPSNS